jgi:hypothetical protein
MIRFFSFSDCGGIASDILQMFELANEIPTETLSLAVPRNKFM